MVSADAPISLDAGTIRLIYAFASVTGVFLGYVVWNHRDKTGGVPLFVAIVGGWWWSTSNLLQTLIASYEFSKLLMELYYVGVVVAVAAIFVFALEYTGREHLVNKWTIGLLSIEPVVVVVLALWNPGNVFFSYIRPEAASATGLMFDFGIGFYLHTLYSYGLVAVASALIIGLVYRTRALYRGQLAVLVGAVLLPIPPNALAIAQILNFDATPLGFLIANGLYTVAITRYRLIDLAPIARDRVVNSVNDGVFVIDNEHRIVDVNPTGEEMAELFVGEPELVGEDAREILAHIPDLDEIYGEIVDSGTEQTVEYELGGGHYMVDAAPIEDTRDRTVGWLFLIRDVTERKRREQQLRARNEQLDKFASVVSHDLRNPLQVASGRVEIARETGEVEHLKAAEESLDRMEAIIEDVLELARGGDEASDLEPVALDDAAAIAWGTVDAGDAALDVRTEARVTADRDRLIRLLENLFRNAVEHGMPDDPAPDGDGGATPAGDSREFRANESGEQAVGEDSPAADGALADARLTITVDVLRENGQPIGFYVADDGVGIAAAERDRIFESGYTTARDGTGFGLTIVSQIAEAHGWSTRVAGSEAGGARIELTGVEVVND